MSKTKYTSHNQLDELRDTFEDLPIPTHHNPHHSTQFLPLSIYACSNHEDGYVQNHKVHSVDTLSRDTSQPPCNHSAAQKLHYKVK